MNIFEQMQKDPSWNNSQSTTFKSSSKKKSTTFESSEPDQEIEFENTSGLAKKYLTMTIGELVRVKGGVTNLKEFAGIMKVLTGIEKDEQAMRERRNELVEKDFIISNVKKYLDLFMSNAFDVVESQKKIITSTYKANLEELEKAETKVEEMRKKALTKISREAVRSIKNSIDGLKKKYDSDDIDA